MTDLTKLKSYPIYLDMVTTYYKKQYTEISEKEANSKLNVFIKNLQAIFREGIEEESNFIATILYNGDGWLHYNELNKMIKQALMDNNQALLEELTKTRVEAEAGLCIINIDHEFAYQDSIKKPYYGDTVNDTILNDPTIKECYNMNPKELVESINDSQQKITETENIINQIKEDEMTKPQIEEMLKDEATRKMVEEILKQTKKEENDMGKKQEETKQEETKEETKQEEVKKDSKISWTKVALYTTGTLVLAGAVAAGVYFYKERDVLVVSEDEI